MFIDCCVSDDKCLWDVLLLYLAFLLLMGKDNDDVMNAVDCLGVNAFMNGINDERIVHFVNVDCSNVTTTMADVDFIFIFFGLPF